MATRKNGRTAGSEGSTTAEQQRRDGNTSNCFRLDNRRREDG